MYIYLYINMFYFHVDEDLSRNYMQKDTIPLLSCNGFDGSLKRLGPLSLVQR